jgi:anaerobic selenocysteine-containing dehydrogenase
MEKEIPTICCPNDSSWCAHKAIIKDGKIVKIEPLDFPDKKWNRICLKGLANIQRCYSPDRLKYPMKRKGKRGEGKWERISWDEAFDIIIKNLEEVKILYGTRAFAWITMTGWQAFLVRIANRFANLYQGTIVHNISLMSDLAAPLGISLTQGCIDGHEPADMANSNYIICWARNLAETMLPSMHFLLEAQEKGAKIVVIDPRFTRTAEKADWWIPIKPGTDAALGLSMIYVLIKSRLYDNDYVSKNTVGPFLVRADTGAFLRESDVFDGGNPESILIWDQKKLCFSAYNEINKSQASLYGSFSVNGIQCKPAWQLLFDLASRYSPEKVFKITGISAEDIYKLSYEYGTNKPAALILGFGMNRYSFGYQAYRTGITLAAITGNLGISGGGASMNPKYLRGGQSYCNEKFRHQCVPNLFDLAQWYQPDENRRAHNIGGMELYDAVIEGEPYQIKALWLIGSNFLNQSPDANKIITKFIPKLRFIVVQDQFLTWTAEYADLLLPVNTQFEREDLLTANHPYLVLGQKVIDSLYESKSDLEIFAGVAQKMGIGFAEYFSKTTKEYIQDFLNSGHPWIKGITYNKLRRKGPIRYNISDPYLPFVDNKFYTKSNKIEFYVEELAYEGLEMPKYKESFSKSLPLKNKKYPLIFITAHSLFSANSSHFNIKMISDIADEPKLEINPADANARGIGLNDIVVVYNDFGRMRIRVKITDGIMAGTVCTTQGWWPKDFIGGHFNELTHSIYNPFDKAIGNFANWNAFDVAVQVKKE